MRVTALFAQKNCFSFDFVQFEMIVRVARAHPRGHLDIAADETFGFFVHSKNDSAPAWISEISTNRKQNVILFAVRGDFPLAISSLASV